YNIISYLNKDLYGKTQTIIENKNIELEIYKEVFLDILKKIKFSSFIKKHKENKVKIIIKNNSLYIDSNKEIIELIFNKILNSKKILNELNQKKINKFENDFFKKGRINKNKIIKLNKKVIFYTILVFHISDILYEKIYNIFKNKNKINLFFDSICVEKENFFLRIAKEGLKENFASVFKLNEFKVQNLEKNEKLNSMEYLNYNFLTKKEKKMISTLNTLQYLQDEKNNYLNYIKEILSKYFITYYLVNSNEEKNIKFYSIDNNYFIEPKLKNKNKIIIEKNLYYFLKNNRKINEINLTKKRIKQFKKLYNDNFLIKRYCNDKNNE
ncbi:MAG: hypothetical protein PHT94_04450, partial [Candidatus Nanoarchaeia archaeon]|nr:hypothetical protein [Candidatus Nanoarchaeia archaeon]